MYHRYEFFNNPWGNTKLSSPLAQLQAKKVAIHPPLLEGLSKISFLKHVIIFVDMKTTLADNHCF